MARGAVACISTLWLHRHGREHMCQPPLWHWCGWHRIRTRCYVLQVIQSADRDMIGWQYPAHARRTAYALSADAVNAVILPNTDILRELWDEGPPSQASVLHPFIVAVAAFSHSHSHVLLTKGLVRSHSLCGVFINRGRCLCAGMQCMISCMCCVTDEHIHCTKAANVAFLEHACLWH